MQQVLLVEDSVMFGRVAKSKIEKEFGVLVSWAKSYAETEDILKMENGNFSMALLDFNLPDAPMGEVIDLVVAEGIPSLVFTTNMAEEVRTEVWKKKVADYMIKEDPNSLDYVIAAMRQLEENKNSLVLIVDDSTTFRTAMSELLYIRKFRVLIAPNGKSALEILEKYPEIELVITDFNMPGIDGCKLCQKIREKFKYDNLAIIGISSEEDRSLGARFIKSGANDFIVKQTFLVEEFYSRVNRSLETVHLIKQIREKSVRDVLTGLHNRRYFFDAGTALLKTCCENGTGMSCTMIDIDLFKKVNDTHGHDIGDEVIKKIAEILLDISNDKDIVARIGGEEFCILTSDGNRDNCFTRMEMLRKIIETIPVAQLPDNSQIFVTCSLGCCTSSTMSLEEMLKIADNKLYEAKLGGRNRVEI
jgi:diguanylate cyclase (GGDEF)-like protein